MISPKQFAKYAKDPAAFRNDLIVDVDGVARKFGDVQDPWQKQDFASIDPALKRSAGSSAEPARMRAYLERPRGHSKTTDLAVTCCWLLAFAGRPLRGYAFAADRDQAALLKDAMANVVRLNPWLGQILDVQKNLVVNTAKGHPGEGGRLDIFTSDVASSYGILPDFIVADELCHWEGDGSLWHSLISSAAKRATCFLCVISNAGFIDSWQWAVREAARTDEAAWIFSRLDGPQASWMTPDRLAEQRRMLPPVAYARLWENRWSSGGGDALTPQDIAAAFRDGLPPMSGSEPGWLYCAGMDLGLVRDCSAVVVLAVPEGGNSGRIRLAQHKLWRPTPGSKVDLTDVERYILEMDAQFGLEFVGFDPWQAEHMAQRLEADSGRRRRNARRVHWAQPWMREIPPTAANLRQQAGLVIESFNDRRLQLYECEPLLRDLLKLRVEEKSYGLRLVSPRDEHGHGDTFSAFANALQIAHELAGKRRPSAGVPDAFNAASPLQRAIQRAEYEARQFEEEQAAWRAGEDHQEAFRELMQLYGRADF